MPLCLSVRMIELENSWTYFDLIWYAHYATGGYPKLVLFNFLQWVVPTWQKHELVRWERNQHLLLYCPEMIYGNRSLKHMRQLSRYFFVGYKTMQAPISVRHQQVRELGFMHWYVLQ
jgi:hypothetical protein